MLFVSEDLLESEDIVLLASVETKLLNSEDRGLLDSEDTKLLVSVAVFLVSEVISFSRAFVVDSSEAVRMEVLLSVAGVEMDVSVIVSVGLNSWDMIKSGVSGVVSDSVCVIANLN